MTTDEQVPKDDSNKSQNDQDQKTLKQKALAALRGRHHFGAPGTEKRG